MATVTGAAIKMDGTTMSKDIAHAKNLVANADRISVLTGAGISTDSGIPDFRGPNGVWTQDPEAERLSTISHYKTNPDIRRQSWSKYVTKNRWADAEPNAGHLALKKLEDQNKLLHIATQNIDGLHHKSGVSEDRISELHGTLRWVVCLDCGIRFSRAKAISLRVDEHQLCPVCRGGILKPDVVYFGEQLSPVKWDKCQSAALQCDLYLAIGTSLQVWPAADLPVYAKRDAGAKLIIINRDKTELDWRADVVINDSISDTLFDLVA